ncbi:hypothetical protein H310_10389 [Aphanomyces invadans]|uniref:Metallo-beta-lactamase domain-containing protein n=1 Tax=Aphanomyces invadans TaxID=157072 RepID=A0A024TPX4_9STRA|nr:hypothetical protein H310_10389 [Aphanomyces invadans]ETV96195.1 hypothetical protein H310_10389 [Aphanomyces invadans]|eukprot:XP_008874987.1 hypothetical protein H310_10389 [Aphanomyces invadans]
MDITFLGTASAQPSPTRNHSSLAFRPDANDVWLFDCGEATQHQLINLMADYADLAIPARGNTTQANSAPRLAKISRIFLTHLHGDHCFGLPGLLSTVGSIAPTNATTLDNGTPSRTSNPVHVYGPQGTKAYVRNMLLHTMTRIGTGFVVHELLMEPTSLSEKLHIDEVEGEDYVAQVTASAHAYWSLPIINGFTVTAAAIPHTVPTVGYLIREPTSPGRLNIDFVRPILERNSAALGLKTPLALLTQLKNGKTMTMPDGTVLTPDNCLAPSRPGRVVVILGDTSSAIDSAFVNLVQGDDVDLIVHEATNACLQSDITAGSSREAVEETAKSHGHSTPELAGAFAKAIGCKRLVLNHFSNRYKGDASEKSVQVMDEVRQLAVDAFGSDNVVCARDFMQVTIAPRL